jgi:hypothetical protein
MIIKADDVNISYAYKHNQVKIDPQNPDFSDLKKEDIEKILSDFNDNQTVLDIIGKEAIEEYLKSV